MLDPEAVVEDLLEIPEDVAPIRQIVHVDVGAQRVAPGGEGPHVQVVDGADAVAG